MARRRALKICLVVVPLLLAGCGDKTLPPTPAPTPTVTPAPLPTPRLPPTPAPTSTATPRQTATPATAPPGDSQVYRTERYKGETFRSAAEWLAKVTEWQRRRPRASNVTAALKAASVGLLASQRLNLDSEILNDKWKHCVVGSEIAVATDQRTAEYAAWLKEHQDLTDGRLNTSFDEHDYEATVDGARQSEQSDSCDECQERCEERWGGRDTPWDGTKPEDGSTPRSRSVTRDDGPPSAED